MITFKKLFFIFCGGIFFFSPHLKAVPSLDTHESFEFDDFLQDINEQDYLTTSAYKNIPPDYIIDILMQIKALSLLEENFFLRTNGINTQNILDHPLLGNMLLTTDHQHVWGTDLFFQSIPRLFLSRSSSNMNSYIAITQDNVLEKIKDIFECAQSIAGSEFDVNIQKALTAIGNSHVQQRASGFMFFGVHQYAPYNIIRWKLPLYYIERNLNIDAADLFALEDALNTPIDQDQSIFDLDPFVRQHCISDAWGLGDTRISAERVIFFSEYFDYWVFAGGLVTLPTACALARGMLGREFCPQTQLPFVDFDRLLNLGAEFCVADPDEQKKIIQNAQKTLSDLFISMLDRIGDTLLTCQLGNNGHFGIGGFLRTFTPLSLFIKERWATSIRMTSYASIEYLAPCNEYRSYITANNPTGFAKRDFTDPQQASANLSFIEQEIINRFFLVARKVRVQPGIIGKWDSKFIYQSERWSAVIGSDTWVQSRGSLRNVYPKNNGVTTGAPQENMLDLQKNHPFMAYRSSIFAGISYTHECNHGKEWRIALNADYVVSQVGIGADFTVLLKVERHF